jgi:hypothetical protein
MARWRDDQRMADEAEQARSERDQRKRCAPIPARRRKSSRANAGSAARPSAAWCARAARRRSWWNDAHSGKRDLEAEWDILSLIARLQAPPAPA